MKKYLFNLIIFMLLSHCMGNSIDKYNECAKENLYTPFHDHCFYMMSLSELKHEADEMYYYLKKYNGTEVNLDFTFSVYNILCDRKSNYGCKKSAEVVNFYCSQKDGNYSIFERYLVYNSLDSVKKYFNENITNICEMEINPNNCKNIYKSKGCNPCFFACNLKYKPPKMEPIIEEIKP